MVSWEEFVVRRSINFEQFKAQHGINTKQDLIDCCSRFNISTPSQEKLAALFPEKIESVEQISEVETLVKPTKTVDNKKAKGAKNK
jgi:hypothetical protein